MTAEDQTGETRLDMETGLDEQLASVIACPNTSKVLTVLTERVASPTAIASQLGIEVSLVSHHVKKLERLGLVEQVDERIVGGAIEHIYRAVVRPCIGNDEWEKLSAAEKRQFSLWILQLMLADATRSFEAGLFDAPRNHLSRTAMVLDRKGFDEVAEIQDRALDEIFEVQARSAERLVGGEEPAVDIVAALTCFEVPEGVKGMKIDEVPSTLPTLAIRKSN